MDTNFNDTTIDPRVDALIVEVDRLSFEIFTATTDIISTDTARAIEREFAEIRRQLIESGS